MGEQGARVDGPEEQHQRQKLRCRTAAKLAISLDQSCLGHPELRMFVVCSDLPK